MSGERYLYCEGDAPLLFTENETNNERIFGKPNASPYVKDAYQRLLHSRKAGRGESERRGHEGRGALPVHVDAGRDGDDSPAASAIWRLTKLAIRSRTLRRSGHAQARGRRVLRSITPASVDEDAARVMRQALAGMLWTKQYFGLDVDKWLEEHGVDPIGSASATRSQPRVVSHGERARHLDAGQMGVSLVRGLGPGVPRHGACRPSTSISPRNSST